MSSLEISNIIKFAKKVRSLLQVTSITDNLNTKVKKMFLNCIIEEQDFKTYKKGLKGKIFKWSDTEIKICYDQNLSFEMKNFTLAHELGHAFLHLGFMTDKKEWNKFKADPKICFESNESVDEYGEELTLNEFEADIFASVLLSGNYDL